MSIVERTAIPNVTVFVLNVAYELTRILKNSDVVLNIVAALGFKPLSFLDIAKSEGSRIDLELGIRTY